MLADRDSLHDTFVPIALRLTLTTQREVDLLKMLSMCLVPRELNERSEQALTREAAHFISGLLEILGSNLTSSDMDDRGITIYQPKD